MNAPVNITPHRVRFLERRLLNGSANDGDISEAASVLGWVANELEAPVQQRCNRCQATPTRANRTPGSPKHAGCGGTFT